jgi:two-component system chemotaxis sensor kinase CheA
VVLSVGEQRFALLVDEIITEQEVLMKNLGALLARVRHVAGATVLGNGEVVLVLNPGDLVKTALKSRPAGQPPARPLAPKAPRSVLVVEDSITSRTLLKNILQSAGYSVHTAVDGQQAWAVLQSRPVDLIVSDVEMPVLNGFELTEKIRADARLATLPVVLVTALGSLEHRRRGLEAGANGYVVISSFDQSNLLEVVGGLMPV